MNPVISLNGVASEYMNNNEEENMENNSSLACGLCDECLDELYHFRMSNHSTELWEILTDLLEVVKKESDWMLPDAPLSMAWSEAYERLACVECQVWTPEAVCEGVCGEEDEDEEGSEEDDPSVSDEENEDALESFFELDEDDEELLADAVAELDADEKEDYRDE